MFAEVLALQLLTAGLQAGPGEPARAPDSARSAPTSSESIAISLDGTLHAARARALASHPEVGRAHAAWTAAVFETTGARRLPDPTLTVGTFLQSIETRVGPQQARVSLQQALPWPGALRGRTEAAVARSEAAAAALEATLLTIVAQVDSTYWTLWELRARRAAMVDHLAVLDGLSDTVRARVETGSTTIATLHQVDLARARLADRLQSIDALEATAHARLAALVGTEPGVVLATSDHPPAPAAPTMGLEAVADHPRLLASQATVTADQARLDVARIQRRPGLMVGADWIPTGPASMDDVADSGTDAIAVGVGVRLPVSWRALRDDVRAAEARVTAAAYTTEVHQRRLEADLAAGLAEVEDTARRVQLTEGTLLPQAESVYTALLGAFAAGRAPLADVLLAQRDLLDLRIERDALHARHARAWAALDALTTRSPTRAGA